MKELSEHSAADAALGFRYQGLYALLLLWREADDEAVILIETLDDVVLVANGQTLLEQLKHTLAEKPAPLTIKSVSLWKTLRVWIDAIPDVDMARTKFHLVSVADIQAGSKLEVLLNDHEDRGPLLLALKEEAERVQKERAEARSSGKAKLPHGDRAAGCKAFLELNEDQRERLISATRLKPAQETINEIEEKLANSLTSVPVAKRPLVAQRLLEWWDRQVLYSMCNKREKAIARFEIVQRHSEVVADLELDNLPSPFATASPPASYRHHDMIAQQILLVGGLKSELDRAIREEWRARETRSVWSTENPTRHDLILQYDERLIEEWEDRHTEIIDQCCGASDDQAKSKGRDLLHWSHRSAPKDIEPISPTVSAPYYIRGSYQVLSITGQVGWHPSFRALLGFTV